VPAHRAAPGCRVSAADSRSAVSSAAWSR
jgi:hypothetical protein